MQDDDDVSISIAFETDQKDVGDAVKSLADTLKGATSLQRATIETKASPPAEGSQGGVVDALTILASSGLAPYALDYARHWWKDHHPVAAVTITTDGTIITEKVRTADDVARVRDELMRICHLNQRGAVA